MALAVIQLAAACGVDADDDARPPPAAADPPAGDADDAGPVDTPEPNPHEAALAERLGEDGTMSTELALEILSAAYGEIPGVEPRIDMEGARDTVGAQRHLAAHSDELDEEQRSALGALLSLGGDTLVAVIEPDAGQAAGLDRPVSLARERSDAIEATTREANLYISERLGSALRIPIHVHVVSDRTIGDAAGDSTIAEPGGFVESDTPHCLIRISETTAAADVPSLRSTVAHEVFHCHQADLAADSSPMWVVEGQAEWVGEEFAGGTSSSAGPWAYWLGRTDVSLLRRGVSAIGFYGAIDADGVDPWSVFAPMLAAGGGTAPLHVALGTDDTASTLMLGRRLVRSPDHGPPWESHGPGITADRATRTLRVPAGTVTRIGGHMPPISSIPLELAISPDPDAPMLRVSVDGGAAELASTGGDSILVRGSIALCVGPADCACPAGADALPSLDIGSDLVATLASPTAGSTTLSFEWITVEDACDAQPADVPTLRMSGAVNLDLAGGYCMTDGVGYVLWIGAGGSLNDLVQPEPYPQAVFRYYASMDRLGTTTDAGTVSYGLHGDDDLGGSSVFTIAPDGLSGTFSLDDGSSGSYTCPALLTEAEVFGAG